MDTMVNCAKMSEQRSKAPRKEADTSSNGRQALDELGLLDRNYSAVTLTKALARKLRRKLFGLAPEIEPAYRLGYVIFDRPDLDGGGPGFGQDYIRVLGEIGFWSWATLLISCTGPVSHSCDARIPARSFTGGSICR